MRVSARAIHRVANRSQAQPLRQQTLTIGVPLCRAEQQRQEGVTSIPAAKAVLSSAIAGFPVAVRAPLLYAVPEQKERLASFFFQS